MEKKLELAMNLIRTDGGTQSRADVDEDAVREYAAAWRARAKFPEPVVYHDGTQYWLSEGFHRVAGARLAGLTKLVCEVREGGRFEALCNSLGSNATHGVRRTNADKRHAVQTCLEHPRMEKWSNVKIAHVCAVDEGLVRKMRNGASSDNPKMDEERLYERNGRIFLMRLGKLQSETVLSGHPERLRNDEDGPQRVRAVDAAGEAPIPPEAGPETAAEPASNGQADGPVDDVPEVSQGPVDELGIPLDARCLKLWTSAGDRLELARLLRRGADLTHKICQAPDGKHARKDLRVRREGRSADDAVRYRIEHQIDWLAWVNHHAPYASQCPYCFAHHRGRQFDRTCQACFGDGWVPKYLWEQAPEDLRKRVLHHFRDQIEAAKA